MENIGNTGNLNNIEGLSGVDGITRLSKVMTGSYDINKFLDGGYEKEVISLFYGPPASGKSNFSILASCFVAKTGKKVVFIDSEGSFSYDRVKQITIGVPENVLKNIVLIKLNSFEEQAETFGKLSKGFLEKSKVMKEKIDSNDVDVGLIVVDSITMLYRLELAMARKKGIDALRMVNSKLAVQMKTLHEIARKKCIPIIVTAQVYKDFFSEEAEKNQTSGVNVIGGDILKYWSKCIIELENNDGRKRASIRKHRSIAEKSINFEIVNEGIRKKGWF